MEAMRAETDSNIAKFKLLGASPIELLNFDAVRFYHSHGPKPERVLELFYAAAERGDLDVVEYLYSTGDIALEDSLFTRAIQEKNLNVIKLFDGSRGDAVDINTAALCGNLDAVKFFTNIVAIHLKAIGTLTIRHLGWSQDLRIDGKIVISKKGYMKRLNAGAL
ncbi:hypothetical protein HDU76_009976, partial [Blyttiomyces sp. JEL0837]